MSLKGLVTEKYEKGPNRECESYDSLGVFPVFLDKTTTQKETNL